MKLLFDYIAKEYTNIMTKNGQRDVVVKELSKLKKEYFITPKIILDVGIGSGLTCKGYISKNTKIIYGVEPSKEMINCFKIKDKRIKLINNSFESCIFNKKVDASYFILTTPFLKNWKSCLKKSANITKDYIIILEQEILKKDFKNLGKGFSVEKDIKKQYKQICFEDITNHLEKLNFFNVIRLEKNLTDINGNSAGKLITLVYKRNKLNVYETAKYIFKINGYCNFNCPRCYAKKVNVELEPKKYINIIKNLNVNDVIALRGGEITLINNWYNIYVKSALDLNLNVILETNGSIIFNKYDFLKYKTNYLTIRISLDKQHYTNLYSILGNKLNSILNKFVIFCEVNKINLEFSALDMNKKELSIFLKEVGLEKYENRYVLLKYYKDISKLKIKGKYVTPDGQIHNKIIN